MITWAVFFSACTLGIFSSFHCIGMCGAIAFSLPTQHLSRMKKFAGIIAYNSGRIFTYALLGILFGVIGRQINILGWQRWFSIIAGIVIIAIVIQTYFLQPIFHFPWPGRLHAVIQRQIAAVIGIPNMQSTFLLGLANGFLPCGLVYLALTGALAAGSIDGSALFMIGFGLGTFPAMFLLSYFGVLISLEWRNKMRQSIPYVIGFMGLLLILRGVGLGIPIISPAIAISSGEVNACH